MLNFDPHRWIAERERAGSGQAVATVATVARVRAENEKSNLTETAATLATPATLSTSAPRERIPGYGGDPASPYYALDDDEGWIGESPRQTRLRLIRGGKGEA